MVFTKFLYEDSASYVSTDYVWEKRTATDSLGKMQCRPTST